MNNRYVHNLKTTDKTKKMLTELEERWLVDYERSFKAALDVQRVYRGMIGRRQLLLRIEELTIIKSQRDTKHKAVELYQKGLYEEACLAIDELQYPTEELKLMKSKICYSTSAFNACERAAREVIEMNSENYDAQYLLAASFVSRNMLQEAFDVLKDTINLMGPRSDSCKLRGYLAAKMHPPKYDLAILDFDFLVSENPGDLNMYLHRACAQVGQQNWDAVIADLTVVLKYQPKETSVLCLRARAQSCKRNWEAAIKDYKTALKYDPGCAQASVGLSELTQPYEDLPMLDTSIIDS